MSEKLHRSPNQVPNRSPEHSLGQAYDGSPSYPPASAPELSISVPGLNAAETWVQENLTPDNIENYYDDYSTVNYKTLQQANPKFAEFYADLMQEFPEFKNIIIYENNEHNGSYNYAKLINGYCHEAISYDYAHPESYIMSETLEKNETIGLKRVLKLLALSIGCDPKDVMQNQDLASAYVFCHELGHAYDFRYNYLKPEYDNSESDVEALSTAIVKFCRNYNRGKTAMPIPGQLDVDYGDQRVLRRFEHRLTAMGIDPNNPDEVEDAHQKAYRDMPAESFADRFAAACIFRHWDEFFESPDDRFHTPGKIRPKIGELIDMSDDPFLLGLTSSAAIRFTPVVSDLTTGLPILENGRPILGGEAETYFLAENLRRDQRFSVLQRGSADPTHGRVVHSRDTVRQIFTIPVQNTDGSISNQIILRMQDANGNFSSLEAEIQDIKPIKVITYPEKMLARLGLAEGSKVQLMKVRQDGGKSLVEEADILTGELICPPFHPGEAPIQYNLSVFLKPCLDDSLDDDSGHYSLGGNTSRLEEVYRIWGRHYIKTESGAIYEVIPY